MEPGTKPAIVAPVFILAPGCCFGGLVSAMLGKHPEMFAVTETRLLVRDTMDEWREHFGANTGSHGLLRSVAEVLFGDHSPAAIKRARNWIWGRREHRTDTVFAELAKQVLPRVLIEATEMVTYRPQHMERALSCFPKARFLQLTRHPVGYGLALLEHYQSRTRLLRLRQIMSLVEDPESIFFRLFDPAGDSQELDPQESWYQRHSDIAEFLSAVDSVRRLSIRMEDVLRDTRTSLRHLCDWLGVQADADAISEMLHPLLEPRLERVELSHVSIDVSTESLDRGLAPLERDMPWSQNGRGFRSEVQQLAQRLGYR